ncbi:MAG TPA: S9 family peptidase [Pirellulaceae bacterium]|nr:S9 family peptidase [Pirellulaceae bacterium]
MSFARLSLPFAKAALALAALVPAALTSPQGVRAAEPVELIPREKFFGNPEKARARVSHDGKQVAFLAPVEAVLNVWVAELGDLENARPVTNDRGRGIREFFWAYTNEHLLYSQDDDGDENFHLYIVDLKNGGEPRDLTPYEETTAEVMEVDEKFPTKILVGLNDRAPHQVHDVHEIDLLTGERKLIQENPGFAGFLTDDNYRVRMGITFTPNAGQLLLLPDEEAENGWKPYIEIGPEDAMTTGPAGFDKSGDVLYMLDSRGRNTAALKSVDLNTGEEKLIAEDERADISDVILHPIEKTVQAVSFTYERQTWQFLDEGFKKDIDFLSNVARGEIQVTSRSLDDNIWTVAFLTDDGPVKFYVYDRKAQKADFLFTSQPELEKLPLVQMHPRVIPARDRLNLVCYLSLPKHTDLDGDGVPIEPLPMALLVHGGPWARDSWGFDPEHQLLANRGYAVLSVNYRGSTGFGKEFLNAADEEWAGEMHNDLLDAVEWAVKEKIAIKERVGIMGGSYGGYATLVGLTFTPTAFACGVDIVGPSSLVTLLENPPPYWAPFMPVMKRRVGDWTTDEGREFLLSRSPLTLVAKIERPLLIGQGAQDPRVKQAEADQIVAAMVENDIPVTYVLFPKEGHGFAKPENRFAFYAIAEAFLAEHLGGRFQPIGDAFAGAEFEIPEGEDGVPGLAEALTE